MVLVFVGSYLVTFHAVSVSTTFLQKLDTSNFLGIPVVKNV